MTSSSIDRCLFCLSRADAAIGRCCYQRQTRKNSYEYNSLASHHHLTGHAFSLIVSFISFSFSFNLHALRTGTAQKHTCNNYNAPFIIAITHRTAGTQSSGTRTSFHVGTTTTSVTPPVQRGRSSLKFPPPPPPKKKKNTCTRSQTNRSSHMYPSSYCTFLRYNS